METISVRAQKKTKTASALARAAMSLFLAKGFEQTTVDEVAQAAGVSRRTLFRYFPAKESLLFPHREERFELFKTLLRSNAQLPPFERVRTTLLEVGAEYNRHKEDILAQHRVIESSHVLLGYEFQLDREWEQALIDSLFRPASGTGEISLWKAQHLAGATIGIIRSTLRQWFAQDCETSLVEEGERALALLEPLFDFDK